MREHARSNTIWDEGQIETVEGVLGMVDQLIIDRCIMEEVKQYHRNQARSHNEANEAVASPKISKKNLPQMKNS